VILSVQSSSRSAGVAAAVQRSTLDPSGRATAVVSESYCDGALARAVLLGEAPSQKPEGHRKDFRQGNPNFQFISSFQQLHDPVVDSASNRDENREISWDYGWPKVAGSRPDEVNDFYQFT
jgi:hypothetical protein